MPETKEILKDLIRISSYVDKTHNESGIIKYVEDFIKSKTTYRYLVQEVEGDRKNILVFNKTNPKIALFGHMDTVLPKMETDKPFEAKEDGNKIFGLGSVDMKSGLAVMLKLMAETQNDELSFVFSVDEEYGFVGALKLKEITDFKPEFIVNVEPTDGKILNGCRGITEFSFMTHGRTAHAGRKEFGINAIEKTVELVKIFQERCAEMDVVGGGKSSVNLAYLHGGLLEDGGEIGSMGNVVPNYSKAVCEIRIANTEIDKQFVETEISKIAEKIGVSISEFKFKFYLGSMLTPKEDLGELERALRENNEEVIYSDVSKAGFFEVQMLQESWGSKCVVYGAGPAEKCHMSDEYVEISSLEKVEKVLRKLIQNKVS